jgi:alanyl-tRNA synthetase
MNQFKPVFLGQVDPSSPLAGMKRAVNFQKCIRAGGKHNDLDDVGKDTYHHTFFEMLGTWSFGDYFKQEAIDWAWDILTNVYGIPADRLYATYCEGDAHLGGTTKPDHETRDMWLKYLPADRVLPGSMKDNFWEMGDTGPCGPATELHYDRIGGRNAASLVNQDDPDVLEVWNLVFIQFNREQSGALKVLPAQHVDTGMGFERLVSVLQDKRSNYDTDLFAPLFKAIEEQIGVRPYAGKIGKEDPDLVDTAYRVLADHARTLSFAIADGAIPSNEGRGYVLRRVLRRAVRYGQQMLGAKPGFFTKLIPTVVESFGPVFPELVAKQALITETIKEEEQAFEKMLVGGIKYLNELADDLQSKGKKSVGGEAAFFLYDTMGFPLDLTQLMAEEKGLSVDADGFAKCMAEQVQRSKDDALAKKAGGGQVVALGVDETAALGDAGVPRTDDAGKYVWEDLEGAKVLAIVSGGALVDEVGADDGRVGVVLDRTAFYAEAGGQVADTGALELGGGARLQVEDVQAFAGFVLHVGRLEGGGAAKGEAAACRVDYARRRKIAPNHSMTHVLNFALRQVLGGTVDQKGSLCDEEKLRFDFTAKGALNSAQLSEVEALVRAQIAEALPVDASVVPLEKALAVSGLRAVFGEQYPDPVRVLAVGGSVAEMIADPDADKWTKGSVELCGGTHVSNTAEAEAFALVQEEAVAKGIRRVTAVTGAAAKQAMATAAELTARIEAAGKLPPAELGPFCTEARQEVDAAVMSAAVKTELRAKLEALVKVYMADKKSRSGDVINDAIQKATEQIAAEPGSKFAVVQVDVGTDGKMLKSVISGISKLHPDTPLLLLSEENGKGVCLTQMPKASVAAGFKANEWLQATLAPSGGRGGGKPDSAQGQVPDAGKMAECIAAAKEFAADKA